MKKNVLKLATTINTFAIALWLSSEATFAQVTNPSIGNLGTYPGSSGGGAPANFSARFGQLFINFWNVLITIGAILVIGLFLLGSLEWIANSNDKSKVEKARDRITQAAVGLVILTFSYAILNVINFTLFGNSFNIFVLNFPTP